MTVSLYTVLEIIGIIAASISGALTAMRKRMDLFGVAILGLLTAVGGGVIRDIILGITPPTVFKSPLYPMIAVVSALIAFIPAVRSRFIRNEKSVEVLMLIMDTLGLASFTVAGIRTAIAASFESNPFLLVFVGTVTGVGGGLLRDICAGVTPYIFVKHFYACASILGSIACVAVNSFFGEDIALLAGMITVIILRLLAAHFRWGMPHAEL